MFPKDLVAEPLPRVRNAGCATLNSKINAGPKALTKEVECLLGGNYQATAFWRLG